MKLLKSLFLALVVLGSLMTPFFVAAEGEIIDTSVCANAPQSSVCDDLKKDSNVFGADGLVTKITNFLSLISGIVSVVIMIYAGVMYITSTGDPKKVATARTTIIYAAIGIVVSLSARLITVFILSKVGS